MITVYTTPTCVFCKAVKEMRALVAEATEVIIEEKLDAKKDESLIKRAFARVGGKA